MHSSNELPYGYNPQPSDILCGKTKLAFNHEGNRDFRATVSKYLNQYRQFPSRTERSMLISSVVDVIHSNGGRFLKERRNVWVVMNVQEARSKVGHALRDAAAHQTKSSGKRSWLESSSEESANCDDAEESDSSPKKVSKREIQQQDVSSAAFKVPPSRSEIVAGDTNSSCNGGEDDNDESDSDDDDDNNDKTINSNSSRRNGTRLTNAEVDCLLDDESSCNTNTESSGNVDDDDVDDDVADNQNTNEENENAHFNNDFDWFL